MFKIVKVLTVFSLLIYLSGCMAPPVRATYEPPKPDDDTSKTNAGSFRMAQSHFTFPNSNVIPIGTAKASASRKGDLDNYPNVMGAIQEAMDRAIASKGGDLMINATTNGTMTTITTYVKEGAFYRPRITFKYDVVVQGTVARMTVGKQKLR